MKLNKIKIQKWEPLKKLEEAIILLDELEERGQEDALLHEGVTRRQKEVKMLIDSVIKDLKKSEESTKKKKVENLPKKPCNLWDDVPV